MDLKKMNPDRTSVWSSGRCNLQERVQGDMGFLTSPAWAWGGGGEERVVGAYHGYSRVEYYGNYIDGTLV